MVVTMHARLSQQAMRQGKTLGDELFVDSNTVDFLEQSNSPTENDYRYVLKLLDFIKFNYMNISLS